MSPEFERDLPHFRYLFESIRREARWVARVALTENGIVNARSRRVESTVTEQLLPPSRDDLWMVFEVLTAGPLTEKGKLQRILGAIHEQTINAYAYALRRENVPERTMEAFEGWMRSRLQQIVTENVACL